ncbi:MAG: hypothetical protein Q9201_004845 [Fulgogasparrea decipioides]
MAATNHVALDLLNKAHPPETASTIFTEKVLHKPLHLRPTSPDPNSQDARAHRRLQRLRKKEKSRRREKPKPLSAKEKRITGIYEIPKHLQKYDIYVPLYRMWLRYIWEILGMVKGKQNWVTAQAAGAKLASADFHAVPKNYTLFKFQIPQPDAVPNDSDPRLGKDIAEDDMGANALAFEVHGSSFERRAIDRATKKFKPRNMTEL